ncbi:MAG: GGDEF domain-containing protein [Planctomycetota bacterium]|nr:GGDEF domain-containing protein [Planctomycetota bacterium]
MLNPLGGIIPSVAVLAVLAAAIAGRRGLAAGILCASNAGILLAVFAGGMPARIALAMYLGADLLGATLLLGAAYGRLGIAEAAGRAKELEGQLKALEEEVARVRAENERGDRAAAGRKQIYHVSRRLAPILDIGDLPREIGKCAGLFFTYRRGELVLAGRDGGGYKTLQAFDIRTGAGIYADPDLMAEMEAEGLAGRFGLPKAASASSALLPVVSTDGESGGTRDSIGLKCAMATGDFSRAIYREWTGEPPPGMEGATRNFASLPFFYRGELAGFVALWDIEGKPETVGGSPSEIEGALLALSQPVDLAVQKCLLYREIERLSRTDPSTEVYKRWFFIGRMREELDRSARLGAHLSLIMIDIDHFKNYNDAYGHQVGDSVLRRVASFLKGNIRAQDLVCRYGGEEFLVGLVQTPVEGAALVAERIRKSVEGFEFDAGGRKTRITISLGVAAFPTHANNLDDLIARADAALYRAKREGRNRTIVAG